MTTCDGCGITPATKRHYRLHRGKGGTDQPINTMTLCDTCELRTHTGIGEQLGWTVRAGNKPERVPMFRLSDERWRRDGVVINPNDAVEYMVLTGQIASGLDVEGRRT